MFNNFIHGIELEYQQSRLLEELEQQWKAKKSIKAGYLQAIGKDIYPSTRRMADENELAMLDIGIESVDPFEEMFKSRRQGGPKMWFVGEKPIQTPE